MEILWLFVEHFEVHPLLFWVITNHFCCQIHNRTIKILPRFGYCKWTRSLLIVSVWGTTSYVGTITSTLGYCFPLMDIWYDLLSSIYCFCVCEEILYSICYYFGRKKMWATILFIKHILMVTNNYIQLYTI